MLKPPGGILIFVNAPRQAGIRRPAYRLTPHPALLRWSQEAPVDDLDARAAKIRLLCTDIDGVLTDGGLRYGGGASHTKVFHVRDGAAIKWLQRAGIPVAFISGLASQSSTQGGETMLILLDLDRLLSDGDLQAIESAGGATP